MTLRVQISVPESNQNNKTVTVTQQGTRRAVLAPGQSVEINIWDGADVVLAEQDPSQNQALAQEGSSGASPEPATQLSEAKE